MNAFLKIGASAGLVLAAATVGHAEEIEKKFRLGFSVGDYDTSGAVHSAAANQRALFLPTGEFDDFLFDPRNDSGAISNFQIQSQFGGVLSASYAVSRLWYIEASVGYRTGGVGNVQVQAQFDGTVVPITQDFAFSVYNLDGGTMSQVPLEFTAGIRFRPKAAFNPYLCAGFGYTFVSYSPSDAINQLSLNLSQSIGGFAKISGAGSGGEGLGSPDSTGSFSGIKVNVSDAPEWHAGGGFEFTVKNRWALYIDARYYSYSGEFGMTINGSSEFGVSVPNDQAVITQPGDDGPGGPFGAMKITQGGLIDGGSYAPDIDHDNPAQNWSCVAPNYTGCDFSGPPDGVVDKGYYYVQAGTVRYSGASVQIGVKFTF